MNLFMDQLSRHCPVQLKVKTRGVALTGDLLRIVQGSICAAVGRFADRVAEVLVWIEDTNGSRGGVDKSCRVTVRLTRGGRLTASAVASNEFAAIGNAANRVRIRFVRALNKRRSRRRQRFRDSPNLAELVR
jgi:ribosome-associated translation inhibitor RaiA